MSAFAQAALFVYMLAAVFALHGTVKIRVGETDINSPLARMLSAPILLAVVGVIFSVLGYVGYFLLLPFTEMIR